MNIPTIHKTIIAKTKTNGIVIGSVYLCAGKPHLKIYFGGRSGSCNFDKVLAWTYYSDVVNDDLFLGIIE